MSLSADQEAMLQLVLERGQSYDDLAGVLGVGVDEVRSRARAALTELAGEDPDAEVGITDYLLGQADPIGRADAVRQLQNDPGTNRLAAGLSERLRELAPDANLPDLPPPRERRQPPAPQQPPSERRARTAGLSSAQQRVMIIVGAAALLVVAVVLGVTGVFGGGSDSGSGSTSSTSASTTASGDQQSLAQVPLQPQGGSDATGEATFGIAQQGQQPQPYVDVDLKQLSAPQAGTTYVVWLLVSGSEGYPLAPIQVDGSEFSDRITIPQFAIPLATRARFVDVSLSENRSLLSDLRTAVKKRKATLPYQGDSVLRGEIPAAARNNGGGGGKGGG